VYAQKVYRGFESLSLRHLPFTPLGDNPTMSYLVLARKWRPQTFVEVIGQPHVTRTLQNAVSRNRIAHAYLFCGARGVGKTSVARILAKTLNCLTPVASAPCNNCSNCREITQGNALDVLEIDGASNRGIDSIRDLRETVRYRPSKSPYKIYIIDEVHMLTAEAFNALLKTLEEPPEHVVFLFATTEPHKIPATILSRCQRFDFRRIPTQELVEHLRHITSQEQVGLPEGVLYALAREADGSMRDAQSLLEQILAFSGEDLTGLEILDILGIVDRQSVHKVAAAVLESDARTCLEVVADLYRRGIDSKRFCQQLCDYFRNLLVLAAGGQGVESLLELPEDEVQVLKGELSKTSPESLHLIFQMILKAEEEIRRSSLPRMTLEMLLLRLTQLPRLESLEEILAKLSSLEDRLAKGPGNSTVKEALAEIPDRPPNPDAPVDPPEPVEMSAQEPFPPPRIVAPPTTGPPPPIDPSETVNQWPGFIRWLKAKDGILAAKLADSQVTLASEKTLGLEVLEIFEDLIGESQALAKLTDAARAFFGHEFQWVVRAKTSPAPEARGMPKAKRSKGNSRRSIMENPVVLQALEILGGELVDIRMSKTDRSEPPKSATPSEPEGGPELL
jgi:DNA polymerase III subunit gamma/tau